MKACKGKTMKGSSTAADMKRQVASDKESAKKLNIKTEKRLKK